MHHREELNEYRQTIGYSLFYSQEYGIVVFILKKSYVTKSCSDELRLRCNTSDEIKAVLSLDRGDQTRYGDSLA